MNQLKNAISLLTSKSYTMKPVQNTRRLWETYESWTTNLSLPIYIASMHPNIPFTRSRHISYQSSRVFLRIHPKICGICWLIKQKWLSTSCNIQNWNLLLWHGNISMSQLATIMHPSDSSVARLSYILKTNARPSWDFRVKGGWNVGVYLEHYWCQHIVTKDTKAVHVSKTV